MIHCKNFIDIQCPLYSHFHKGLACFGLPIRDAFCSLLSVGFSLSPVILRLRKFSCKLFGMAPRAPTTMGNVRVLWSTDLYYCAGLVDVIPHSNVRAVVLYFIWQIQRYIPPYFFSITVSDSWWLKTLPC